MVRSRDSSRGLVRYVESIAWGSLADINPAIPGGGLLDDMLKPKPSFAKIQELRETFHRKKG